ncbi:hypothetical protein NPIL_564841 [Nephila pilipes]|uniref:Uncharacterized protein n=1 Tax=Nephila pilipes TaxID=299642 RepID=A0A8X6P0V5_NEPPI|nr:hypothetical protein NPIL_564841 [Nephila pilipes]
MVAYRKIEYFSSNARGDHPESAAHLAESKRSVLRADSQPVRHTSSRTGTVQCPLPIVRTLPDTRGKHTRPDRDASGK